MPLVAATYGRTGGFQTLFMILAGLAVLVFAAALCFPHPRRTVAAAPAE